MPLETSCAYGGSIPPTCELSTRRVLVLDYVRGISPAAATSGAYAPALRDLWGRQLLRYVMSGLLEHRFLHADPNFGNFAFREDGRLVVYDHGCVKDVPEDLARGCAQVLAACLDQDIGALALRLPESKAHALNEH